MTSPTRTSPTRTSALSLALALAASTASAQTIVVPNHATTTAGTGGYSTLLNSAPRSYQLVVGPAELTGLPVGSRITGIAWRRPTWQVFPDWPGAGFTCTFSGYDVYLSSSLNPPGSLSTTYTDNIGPDVVLARAGSISYSNAFFPGGALSPQVNPFGATVPFSTPYVYQGGDLLLTVRHTGNNCGGSGSLDTVSSPHAQAIGVSSYTQADNWYAQGLITMQLSFELPPGTPYCFGDGSLATPCPCANTGAAGRGCANSLVPAGAKLAAGGTTNPDTLVLTATDELASALSIFLQGNSSNPSGVVFGDGVRCVAGSLKRIAVRNASGGTASYPGPGDPSISAVSAALGDTIVPGTTRWYQTYYRDPVLEFCPQPAGNSWNVTSGLAVDW